MDSFSTFWNSLDWSILTNMLLSVIPALLCITVHELSHGFAAHLLGDDTANNAGRLTLNQIKHIDIMGLLMMVVFRFGWAKPVPIQMRNFKKPKRDMAISALAGPVSNVILCCLALAVYGAVFYPLMYSSFKYTNAVLELIMTTAYLSAALAVFNIIPISPLDGSKVLFAFLPERHYYRLMYIERYGMIILFALVFVLNRVSMNPLSMVTSWVFDKFFNIALWCADIVWKLM